MKELILDDLTLRDKVICDRRLIYGGGGVIITGSTFVGCPITLVDEAENTVRFLAGVYASGGVGALMVERLFEAIRTGRLDEARRLLDS